MATTNPIDTGTPNPLPTSGVLKQADLPPQTPSGNGGPLCNPPLNSHETPPHISRPPQRPDSAYIFIAKAAFLTISYKNNKPPSSELHGCHQCV